MPKNNSIEKGFQEVKEKYSKFKSLDPFPDIYPALLNSADIVDYVKYTGMIFPFYEDIEHLKPATYAIQLKGKIVTWNEDHKKKVHNLGIGQTFILKSNSIAFVTLEPFFQIPYYIAARFNLKINNVYRGLLLGTGPIIDPGFCGHLSLPLHNLTNNDYEFTGGEQLIWMEFTKLSANQIWQSSSVNYSYDRKGKYYEYNKPTRLDKDVEYYLKDAFPGAIDSSLPNIDSKTKKALKKINRQINFYNIAILVTFLTILFGVVTLIRYFTSEFRDSKKDLETKIKNNEILINKLNSQHIIDSLHFQDLENTIKKLPK